MAIHLDKQEVKPLSNRAKIDAHRFPPLGYRGTSHVQLTPDERPNLTDGIISTAWSAGTLYVQYVGLERLGKPAVDTVSKAMWRFATECQRMVVLYAGVLLSRATIQSQIGSERDRDTPFAITTTGKDGDVSGIWAWLPTGVVLDAFSAGGEFETTFAKSFVVSAYQTWEEVTRPQIAEALDTSHNEIRSDLMGEWRHLRNWLVHPSEETEVAYFKNANLLARIPGGPAPGKVPDHVRHGSPDGIPNHLGDRESSRPVTWHGHHREIVNWPIRSGPDWCIYPSGQGSNCPTLRLQSAGKKAYLELPRYD